MQTHAAVALAAFQFFAILQIAILRSTDMPQIGTDVFGAVLAQPLLVQRLRITVEKFEPAVVVVVDRDGPAPLVAALASRRRGRRAGGIDIIIDPQVLAAIWRIVNRENSRAVSR